MIKQLHLADEESRHSALEPEPDFYHGREVLTNRRGEPINDYFVPVEISAALAGKCESPIEYKLGPALIVAAEKWGFRVVPQFKLGRYRYDFALYAGQRLMALNECDGKEFHSKPEQRANDEAKDCAAKAAGTRVLRATGADIYRGPQRCAEEIIFRVWGT